jgi:PhzF family phenazine biosynthesis protein
MKIRQYQVDAFTEKLFAGNPAAVCPLDAWLDDDLLQAIAEENNLSETAFFVPHENGFQLRWFTPVAEVDLCGHATLASAHVLFEELGYPNSSIEFDTRSGKLFVGKMKGRLVMEFPVVHVQPCEPPLALLDALGKTPREVLVGDDYIAVFDNEVDVLALIPDLVVLKRLDRRGVIVTAPGTQTDFVSRFFAPKLGIAEDPVTGSAHCALTPYWAPKLGKTNLTGFQASKRGGYVGCELRGDRVLLTGIAVTFMKAEIELHC